MYGFEKYKCVTSQGLFIKNGAPSSFPAQTGIRRLFSSHALINSILVIGWHSQWLHRSSVRDHILGALSYHFGVGKSVRRGLENEKSTKGFLIPVLHSMWEAVVHWQVKSRRCSHTI